MSLNDLTIARILTFFPIFVYLFCCEPVFFRRVLVSWFHTASVVSYLRGSSDSSGSLSSQLVSLFLCLILHFPRRVWLFFSPLASSLALNLILDLWPRSRPSSSGFGFFAFGLILGLRSSRLPSGSPSDSVLGLKSRHRPSASRLTYSPFLCPPLLRRSPILQIK